MEIAKQIQTTVAESRNTLGEWLEKLPKCAPIAALYMRLTSAVLTAMAQLYWDVAKDPKALVEAAAKVLEVPIGILEDLKPVTWQETEAAIGKVVEYFSDMDRPYIAAFMKYVATSESLAEQYEAEIETAMKRAGFEVVEDEDTDGEEDEEE